MFTDRFDNYVCVGDTMAADFGGLRVVARIEFDYDIRDPEDWDEGVSKEALAAWRRDEWFYCGVVLAVYKNGVQLDEYAAGLWGINANYPGSDNSYLTEVANELLPEALERGRAVLASLCA